MRRLQYKYVLFRVYEKIAVQSMFCLEFMRRIQYKVYFVKSLWEDYSTKYVLFKVYEKITVQSMFCLEFMRRLQYKVCFV